MEHKRAQQEAKSAKFGALAFTVAALVMTGIVAYLLAQILSKNFSAEATLPVVVAKRNLDEFTDLKAEHLNTAMWPVSAIPEGAFSTFDQVLQAPRRLRVGLRAGEPILQHRLTDPTSGIGVDQLVDPNMRAFTVRVSNELATARTIQPGVFVDVIATMNVREANDVVSKVVLQNKKVLMVGRQFDRTLAPRRSITQGSSESSSEHDAQGVVTLLVEPEEVEVLALVSRTGKIDLVLRNASDALKTVSPGASINELFAPKKDEGSRQSGSGPRILRPFAGTSNRGPVIH